MFKKISFLLLAIGNLCAMESSPITQTDYNSIKQSIKEIKQISEDNKDATKNKISLNDIEEQFDNLNIDEMLRQANSRDNDANKTKNKTRTDKHNTNSNIFLYEPSNCDLNRIKNKTPSKSVTLEKKNKNKLKKNQNNVQDGFNLNEGNKNNLGLFNKAKRRDCNDNPNKIIENVVNTHNNEKMDFLKNSTDNLFDEDELNTAVIYSEDDDTKEFLNCFHNDDQYLEEHKYKYNWNKIDIRNQFSQLCHEFLRKVIKLHKITERMMSNFCNSDAFYNCVEADLEPSSILEEVYAYNINMSYMTKPDVDFLKGQMRHLSRLLFDCTKKIKQHQYGVAKLQNQLGLSETEASQIYWDSYWSNYSLFIC